MAFENLRKKALSKVAGTPQGRQKVDDYLQKNLGMSAHDFARLQPEQQEALLREMPGDVQGAVQAAVGYERNEAFKRGEKLPGVSPSGQGTTLDDRGRAAAIAGQGIQGVQDAAGSVSGDVGDYTYNPTMDPGAGRSLEGSLTYYGDKPFDQLESAMAEKANDQTRTDASGYEGQKFALGEMKKNYGAGGLSAIDRARMDESRRVRDAQARGAREALGAQAAEQGRMGGNLEYLLSQKANQDASSGRASDDLQTQGLALQRQDAMLRGMGDIGGSMQAGVDAIDHFNSQGRRDIEQRRFANDQAIKNTNWEEKTGREHADVDTHNKGAATDFAVDTGRSAQNTDRTNQAAMYNVSPTGGARGMFRDKLAAAEAAAGQGNTAAAMWGGFARDEDQAKAAQDAATAQWATGLLQMPASFATAWATRPSTPSTPSTPKTS